MAWATCHTPGCGNAGIPIDVDTEIETEDGGTITVGVQCGVCGQPITDVADDHPDPDADPDADADAGIGP